MHRRPAPRAPLYPGGVLVLLAATFLRMWALAETDIGLHYDEAAMLLLTRDIASGTSLPIFIQAFTGHEVAFHYIAALVLRFGSDTVLGMRLAAAAVGVVTVAATLAAAQVLFAPWRTAGWIALFAAAGMAVAFPHVLFSRYGFRAIAQPMFQALAIAALWIGLRTGKLRWLAAGGALVGLTGHTYLAARLFPIPLALAVGWWLICTRSRQTLRDVAVVVACAALAFAPLALFFVQNPGTFTVRVGQVASPTVQDALRGVNQVAQAFGLPGHGDPYIRFNLPGRPMLDPISAAFALIGLIALLFRRIPDAALSAARVLIVAGLAIMPLASALATSEITPSHLRMLGVYPFVVVLPALGLAEVLVRLPRREIAFPLAFAVALVLGTLEARQAYGRWAASSELFAENHGDMALAARALDELDLHGRTAYIASEHYQHPTVAALARNYSEAKWLTGGATIVLPAQGDAIYLVPASLQPPAPWADDLTRRWHTEERRTPDGSVALRVHRLGAQDVAAVRAALPVTSTNFAYVVGVRAARPLMPCRAGETCPVLVAWDIRAPFAQLQPVARVFHPDTGEWGRTNPFHYPASEWTVGETVLDQLAVPIAPGTPPVDGNRIGIGFFNPETGDILPRLNDADRFAGIEADFPLGRVERSAAAAPEPPQLACREDSRINGSAAVRSGTHVLAWTPFEARPRPGERLAIELCWQAGEAVQSLDDAAVEVRLVDGATTYSLYRGPPAAGAYPFTLWRTGEVVRDRVDARIPRDARPGRYALEVWLDDQRVAAPGEVEIVELERNFALPEPTRPAQATLGGRVALLGYDLGETRAGQPLSIRLYWRALAEMDEDYTAFVHLIDRSTGALVAQSDAMPGGGTWPTSLWVVDQVIDDAHTLSPPADLPPGDYLLRAGLYRPASGEHLLVGGQDGVDLGRIRLMP
jgi:hypothetical protein